MLLLIFFAALIAIGFIAVYFDNNYWHTEGLLIAGAILGILGIIAMILAVIALITALCYAPSNQAEYELKYDKLISKVEHIDSYNYEEVVAAVDEWNQDWRTNTYARQSPWIGLYNTIDTSTTDLIKINN